MYSDYDQGYTGYPDARDGMGALAGMGGLTYVPNLADVGRGPDYWPGDVSADTAALEYVRGDPPGYLQSEMTPSTGSQQGDIQAQAGAWDKGFQTVVADFQDSHGLTSDGWIGPDTRGALAAAVALKNAQESPIQPPYIPPGVPPAPGVPPPAVIPGLPGPSPAVYVPPGGEAPPANDTHKYLMYGAAAVLLVGLGLWAIKD